jgi:hypothetical protein
MQRSINLRRERDKSPRRYHCNDDSPKRCCDDPPNQVLITDECGCKRWINQCSFNGLNNTEIGTVSSLSNIVVKITGATNNCLETLQSNNSNQVLITNNSSLLYWQNQCDFAGLSTLVSSIVANGVVVNTGTASDCLVTVQPNNNDSVLVVDDLGAITWIAQCDFAGLSTLVSSIIATGVVVNTGSTSNCLVTVQSNNNDTVLIVDDTGATTWIAQCEFAGLNTLVPSITGIGVVVNTGTANNCLVTVQSINNNSVLIVDNTGAITWIAECNFAGLNTLVYSIIANGIVVNTGSANDCLRTVQSTSNNSVLIVDNTGAITWIAECNFAGLNMLVSSIVANGVVVNTGSANNCLRTVQSTSNNSVLIVDNTGAITWIAECNFAGLNTNILSVAFNNSGTTISGVVVNNGNMTNCLDTVNPGTLITNSNNKVFITDNSANMTWINQCDFGNINVNQVNPLVIPSNTDYSGKRSGVIVRVENATNNNLCLWDVQPGITGGTNSSNEYLVTDDNGNITWQNSNVDIVNIFPDGIIKDNVVSIAANNEAVNGFGNEGEEVISEGITALQKIHNSYSKDIIYVGTNLKSQKSYISLAHYGNGYDRSVQLGNTLELLSGTQSYVNNLVVIMGNDFTNSTYSIALFYVTGASTPYTLNFDIYTVTSHTLSYIKTETFIFAPFSGPPPTIDTSLVMDITYNRDYLLVGSFSGANAYMAAYQLNSGNITNPTPMQTLVTGIANGTSMSFASVRSDTFSPFVSHYSITMLVNPIPSSLLNQPILLAIVYNTSTNIFSVGNNIVSPYTSLNGSNVNTFALVPIWSGTASTTQIFLLVEDNINNHETFYSPITINSSTVTIAGITPEVQFYPTSPVSNLLSILNLSVGPTIGPDATFAFTTNSIYDQSPLIMTVASYNVTTNILTWGTNFETQPTNNVNGNVFNILNSPMVHTTFNNSGILLTTDIIVLTTNNLDNTGYKVTNSLIACTWNPITLLINFYSHRGQGPYGVARITANSGTATVTIEGLHQLTVNPLINDKYVLFAHGNGVISKNRKVNLTLPYPVYIPVPKYAIVKDGKFFVL